MRAAGYVTIHVEPVGKRFQLNAEQLINRRCRKNQHLILICRWTCVIFLLRQVIGRQLLLEVFPKIAVCLTVVTEHSLTLACFSILDGGTDEFREKNADCSVILT